VTEKRTGAPIKMADAIKQTRGIKFNGILMSLNVEVIKR